MLILKEKLIKAFKLIGSYSGKIGLFLGVVALGLSIFNTYQINSGKGVVAADAIAQAEAPEKILKELPKNVPYLGNPKAKLTIVEFGDFQCPYCGKFFKQIYPDLKKEYIDTGKVKFVYMDYAFLGQESVDAAKAAKCASEQGKYWEYHDELYNNQNGENAGAFNGNNLKKFAVNVGLDSSFFETCISSTKYDKEIQDALDLAKKYGVNATPGFLIGKKTIKGAQPITTFQEIINTQL